MQQSMISVVMPVYNAAPYVGAAIESILNQNYTDFEFIIVDDGSEDGSVEIIQSFARQDARIKLIYLKHGGAGKARNAGMLAAQGTFIAFMDADDIAVPERFETQLDWMAKNSIDICGSCVKTVYESDRILWFPETHEAICADLFFRCALLQPTVMMRSEIAKNHLYNENIAFEDYEYWSRLATKYQTGNIQQILVKYRKHKNQTSTVRNTAFGKDQQRFRKKFFFDYFPDAQQADYAALTKTADKIAFDDLTELELAGNWLLRLAQSKDIYLRKRMLRRWKSACLHSAHLGISVYTLYRKTVSGFQLAQSAFYPKLLLACTLRLKVDSALYGWASRTKRSITVRLKNAV